MTKRSDEEDLRAVAKLIVDATIGVTNVVESMQRAIGAGPAILGRPFAAPTRLLTAPSYALVRGVTRAVGALVDQTLKGLSPLFSERTPGPQRLALLAALNGVLGDRLADARSPLALQMTLCRSGAVLNRATLAASIPQNTRRLLILIHGSSVSDAQWLRDGHDHGAFLEQKLGVTSLYVRYNSGLNVGTNGGSLARLLEELCEARPHAEISLLGHSMGGLVARSACTIAEQKGMRWRKQLRHLVCLGSPHHGAPLERMGNWVDYLLSVTPYSAPLAALGKIRSAGVTDLRHGSSLALPKDVRCLAVAASKSSHAARKPRGDGLVPVASALGMHIDPSKALAFDESLIMYATDHLGLLSSQEVAKALQSWLF